MANKEAIQVLALGVQDIQSKLADLTQLVVQNQTITTTKMQRPTILGLCTLAEVNRMRQPQRLALLEQLRAAITDETTDVTMDHDGGESGRASSFAHLTGEFEAVALRAFDVAGITEMRGRMKVEIRGPVVEMDSDVGALVWLNGLLALNEPPQDPLSRREIILYRNNIRWRMFNQEHSSAWMREHLWRTATRVLTYLECQPVT